MVINWTYHNLFLVYQEIYLNFFRRQNKYAGEVEFASIDIVSTQMFDNTVYVVEISSNRMRKSK